EKPVELALGANLAGDLQNKLQPVGAALLQSPEPLCNVICNVICPADFRECPGPREIDVAEEAEPGMGIVEQPAEPPVKFLVSHGCHPQAGCAHSVAARGSSLPSAAPPACGPAP